MEQCAELCGEIVEAAAGRIVKFIGDAALVFFPGDLAGPGILALKGLRETLEEWFREQDVPCRLRMQIHYGPVMCGPFGTKNDKRFDVFGQTVNTAATLTSYGISITPQAFRKLDKEGRKLFKKHTPPVRYIPVEEHHKD